MGLASRLSHAFLRVLVSLLLGLLAVGLPVSADGLGTIDVRLPSESTGSPDGTLAVRIHAPEHGGARYPEGAPVIVWILGGFEVKGINHGLPPIADDVLCISLIFPGGSDPWSGLSSDGVYDYRGPNCIAAVRDVILYAAGKLSDSEGRTIDEITPVPVLHDNIGLIGESNGGNLLTAVAALHGDALAGHLRYVIQWETPVSSQIATRDFGRVWLKPSTQQGNWWNPRIEGYGRLVLATDYTDLVYDPSAEVYPLFHDGNEDGRYTTVRDPQTGLQVPDLNLDGVLGPEEDFPLDTYPLDETRVAYSRPVTEALAERNTFADGWPERIAQPDEASAYWDLRESTVLYADAAARMPELEAMILCNARDHVQALPDKPHIRQAFDGWNGHGAWVKINPSPAILRDLDPNLANRPLPDLPANTPPQDWSNHTAYALPVNLPKPIYELAAIYEMADRARNHSAVASAAAPTGPAASGTITYVESLGIGEIAVQILPPNTPRYGEGAPVVVNVSGFFTGSSGFDHELDPESLGAVYITYLWPGKTDPATGARSEGTYDYGGPDCLAAVANVIQFATGETADIHGRYLHDLVAIPVLYEISGLYAFSHSGIAATNVLALHGGELSHIGFFVGRENPTLDAMYPLESGHFDDTTGRPIVNPYYDPAGYTSTSIDIDYSTVAWSFEDGLPVFEASDSKPAYLCSSKHPRMWGKDYWSADLLQALLNNGSLSPETWPETLATPDEAVAHWPFRTTTGNYTRLGEVLPDLKVMLVFAADDHVQAAPDKPHIHQAYDGFHETAGLWCRLNPDRSYVDAFAGAGAGNAIPDNPANREPTDWMQSRRWGYRNVRGSQLHRFVALAAVAEMCDRTYANDWLPDLTAVLSR